MRDSNFSIQETNYVAQTRENTKKVGERINTFSAQCALTARPQEYHGGVKRQTSH